MIIAHRSNAHAVGFLILALVLWASAIPCGAGEFAGGTGEPNDPYLIATAEQLLAADFTKAGVCYQLCSSIDLDRRNVNPCYFRAHLDGAGFEIQNARILHYDLSLFGVIEPEGTIANLTLADLDLGTTAWGDPCDLNYYCIGAMAGENRGTIRNCAVTGWVVAHRGIRVGGLVGLNKGSITNCYFDGWVSTDWEITEEERQDTGIFGYVGGLVSGNEGIIRNSFARAIVVGTEGLGGLAGCNWGTIENCYSWGMVIGGVGSGGLVAVNGGSLRRCYTISSVMGVMGGGLAGMAGIYGGSAIDCLWDRRLTHCLTSDGGVGVEFLGADSTNICGLNGWAGDPNWVVSQDSPGDFENYPRLAWEGTPGVLVPEYPASRLFDSGDGTEADPYRITSEDALIWLCTKSILWDAHFILAADLNMAARSEFSPIGVGQGCSFSGTFDGNGHVIRNLNFDFDLTGPAMPYPGKATARNLGVFGYVTGEVCNLRLENIQYVAGMHSKHVGLLAGTSKGVIRNCSATGSIRVGENSDSVGQLIGYNTGEIIECEAAATIEAGEGSTYIGGLAGWTPTRRGDSTRTLVRHGPCAQHSLQANP